jgi:hypothetical protein
MIAKNLIALTLIAGVSIPVLAEQTEFDKVRLTQDEALNIIKSSMRDPDSVKFEKVKRYTMTLKDGSKGNITCGNVNAKNAYGGYVGYKKFYVISEKTFGVSNPIQVDEAAKPMDAQGFLADSYCKNHE